MLREELEYKLSKKFGTTEGHKKYTQIKEFLDYTYKHINECGFALEFYDKIFNIINNN